jgi:hypothetical protein
MLDAKKRLDAAMCVAILQHAGFKPGTDTYKAIAQAWFEPAGDQETYYVIDQRAIDVLNDMPVTKT